MWVGGGLVCVVRRFGSSSASVLRKVWGWKSCQPTLVGVMCQVTGVFLIRVGGAGGGGDPVVWSVVVDGAAAEFFGWRVVSGDEEQPLAVGQDRYRAALAADGQVVQERGG